MESNIAVIDLGSNLTKLIIVENSLPLKVVHRSIYDTKTLKNAPNGVFDARSISMIERDISEVLKVTKRHNCNTHLGIATSSFRTRENGQETINHINSLFGTQIEIIEGSREAQLIYQGAKASVPNTGSPVLVMDIGGGSTEFIIGSGADVKWKHSFDFGSTALTRDMDISNPILEKELVDLRHILEKILEPLFEAIELHHPKFFIGTTGAFHSFSQIIQLKKGLSSTVSSGFTFTRQEILPVLAELIASTVEFRSQSKGIHPLRVDTVHIAAVIFDHFLSKVLFQTMTLSLGDLKEGLAKEYIEHHPSAT
jgi:exopolyphosphatase/guanosine-5'-triphosphate,3'-diphosphate pyrophosphatase